MNTLNPYKAATLLVAVVTLVVGLAIIPAQAHCPHRGSTTHRHCDGVGGDPTPQECALEFRGTFDDRGIDRVRSDGDPYINDVEKVQFTSGTLQTQGMLRFDTNGSAKVEKPQDIRKVTLDFPGASSHPVVAAEVGFEVALKGIDMRFDFTDGVGLNVCSLNVGETGHVVLDIVFLTAFGEDYALSYGCRLGPGVPPELDASKADVTRTSGSTWTIEGMNACLRDGPGAYYPRIDLDGDDTFTAADEIQMPFFINLEAVP